MPLLWVQAALAAASNKLNTRLMAKVQVTATPRPRGPEPGSGGRASGVQDPMRSGLQVFRRGNTTALLAAAENFDVTVIQTVLETGLDATKSPPQQAFSNAQIVIDYFARWRDAPRHW
jgi:hypothetical protein